MDTILNFSRNNSLLIFVNTFFLIGSCSVGVVYQPNDFSSLGCFRLQRTDLDKLKVGIPNYVFACFVLLYFAFILCILNVFFPFSLRNGHQCRHFFIVPFLPPCPSSFEPWQWCVFLKQ